LFWYLFCTRERRTLFAGFLFLGWDNNRVGRATCRQGLGEWFLFQLSKCIDMILSHHLLIFTRERRTVRRVSLFRVRQQPCW
jgi:hypothetical protein